MRDDKPMTERESGCGGYEASDRGEVSLCAESKVWMD